MKMQRKVSILWLVICFLIIGCLTYKPTMVQAAGVDLSAAAPITLGNTINGVITEDQKAQVYLFNLPSAGRITFDMESHMKFYTIRIYDFNGDEVWYTDSNKWNESLKYIKKTHTADLTAGSYYLRVTGEYYYFGWRDSDSTGTFLIGTSFVSAEETVMEPNNEFSQAAVLNVNGTTNGQIASNDREDIFKFTLQEPGRLTIDVTSYMKYYSMKLFDNSGEYLWDTDGNKWNENLEYRSDQHTLDLSASTYYLRVTGYERSDDGWGSSTGNYTLKTSFEKVINTIIEPNDEFSNASELALGKTAWGQIAIDDRYDICKFSLNKDIHLGIYFISYMKYYTLEIYDTNGKCIWYDDWNERNENADSRDDIWRVSLDAGTYYLRISGYGSVNSTSNASTGKYEMYLYTIDSINDASVSKIKSRTFKYEYIKPSVKVVYKKKTLKEGVDYQLSYENNYNIGKATIIITGIGHYAGTKRVTFNIIPKAPKIEKAYNSAKGIGYMAWTRGYGVDGYEVYQSSKKTVGYKFRHRSSGYNYNAVEMYKLTKGKTYYFKVRSYKVVDGKKYYSKFSSPKAIKIKK